ncbi:MAG: response regulator transcription factor [Acidimicrobiia bacterium]
MSRRVLIADDEPNIVTSLEFLMGREGHRVAVARNGAEALELVESFRPHLVLLDVAMPKLDGFTVAQRIRASRGAEVAIIMLTAKGREVEIEKGLALGADLYVTKPFSTRDLVADVRRLLDR